MTDFKKLNDYTLSSYEALSGNSSAAAGLRKIFNFQAQQVTTIYERWLVSGGSALTSQMTEKNFDELGSLDEVYAMAKELEAQGGTPNVPAEGYTRKEASGAEVVQLRESFGQLVQIVADMAARSAEPEEKQPVKQVKSSAQKVLPSSRPAVQ